MKMIILITMTFSDIASSTIGAGQFLSSHILGETITLIIIAIAAILARPITNMLDRFSPPKDVQKDVIVSWVETYLDAIFEAVNNGTRDVVLKAHGLRYYDNSHNQEWFGYWNRRLKPEDRTGLTVPNTTDLVIHHYNLLSHAVYCAYVTDNSGKEYRYFPEGYYRGHIKRFWYWATGRKFKVPPVTFPTE